MLHSFRVAIAEARRHGDLYFAALVDRQSISEAFGEASSLWQGWIYTPAVTVWVFLSQCLSPDHSCRDAVARLSAWRTAKVGSPVRPTPAPTARRGRVAGGRLSRAGPPQRPRTRSPKHRENGCGMGAPYALSMARR